MSILQWYFCFIVGFYRNLMCFTQRYCFFFSEKSFLSDNFVVTARRVSSNVYFSGILRYKVDFQSMQLDDNEIDSFDLDDY